MVGFWLDCGWTVVGLWLDCGWTVVGLWLDRGWIVVGLWLDCGWIVVGLWLDRGWIVVGNICDFNEKLLDKIRLYHRRRRTDDTERHGETQRDADRHSKRHRR